MENNVPGTLGRRIAKMRDQRDWTQKRLAEEAEISVTFLSEVENDKRSVSADVLLRLADALGASLDYLIKGEIEPPKQRQPLVIPPELAEAAEEMQWSFGIAQDLLKARQIVIARRSRAANTQDVVRPLSKQEWINLHESLFGNEFPE